MRLTLPVVAALFLMPGSAFAQYRAAAGTGYFLLPTGYGYTLPNPYSFSSPPSAFYGSYGYTLPNPYSFSSPPSAFGCAYSYTLPNPYSFSSPPSVFGYSAIGGYYGSSYR
jgi:hypothetical protein